MDMKVDTPRIRFEREQRAWSQSHLADVSGLGLRTVQRIEASGRASYESASAIAAAFSTPVSDLRTKNEKEVIRPRAITTRQASLTNRRVVVPLAVAGVVVAASLVYRMNDEVGSSGVGPSMQRCPFDGEYYPVGSTKRAVEISGASVLRCVSREGRVRWDIADSSD